MYGFQINELPSNNIQTLMDMEFAMNGSLYDYIQNNDLTER